jgi:hypothetical protein
MNDEFAIVVNIYDKETDTVVEESFPAKYVVCEICKGSGKEDECVCYFCKGLRVNKIFDKEKFTEHNNKMLALYYVQKRENDRFRKEV